MSEVVVASTRERRKARVLAREARWVAREVRQARRLEVRRARRFHVERWGPSDGYTLIASSRYRVVAVAVMWAVAGWTSLETGVGEEDVRVVDAAL